MFLRHANHYQLTSFVLCGLHMTSQVHIDGFVHTLYPAEWCKEMQTLNMTDAEGYIGNCTMKPTSPSELYWK